MSMVPEAILGDLARAKRLEWWTLGGMATVLVAMYFTMGASKAMQSALIEDVLSLVPAMTFLITARLEPREPTAKYPFGFVRVNSLAFLIAAVALMLVGLFLIWESAGTLIRQEHPTVPPMEVFGQDVWLGWLMIAALVYSIIPPVILGHIKQPVAKRLRDKVLHTDALMQKADWQTGVAGIAGIIGIGLGYWWADSGAALFIAASVLKDGFESTRMAAAELLDGAPRELDTPDIAAEAVRLRQRIEARWPDGTVRIRESGRYMIAMVDGVDDPGEVPATAELMGDDPSWRLERISFAPRTRDPD